MKLYHQPRSRSTRIRWALEEIGAPYELAEITREFKQTPEYRAVHPLGRSPALVLDGGPMFESAAMILQVADLHPEASLIGPVGSHARALHYQWAFFAMIELEGPASDIARQLWKSDGDPIEEVLVKARARLATAIGLVVSTLGDRSFLVDDRFSVADITVGGVLSFVRTAGLDTLPADVLGYVDSLEARDARVRAYS
jgi:glutathione S-transferase